MSKWNRNSDVHEVHKDAHHHQTGQLFKRTFHSTSLQSLFAMHALSRNNHPHSYSYNGFNYFWKDSPSLWKHNFMPSSTKSFISRPSIVAEISVPLPLHTRVNNFSLLWEGSVLPLAALHYSIFTEVSASLLWAVNWPQMYGVVHAKVHP